jgi:Icc-related predicted phosphoesterase
MRILAFSDLHCDLAGAARLVERSRAADAVVCAGDLASVHSGLEETIAALRPIDVPTVLVPGNNETDRALRAACEDWPEATVLHGEGTELNGVEVYGLGAGIPITPWDWSFDLDEDAGAAALAQCPPGALLVVHSPPYGHVDSSRGRHLGSRAILDAIEEKAPSLAVCGHIHESWGERSRIGETEVLNLGPEGVVIEM